VNEADTETVSPAATVCKDCKGEGYKTYDWGHGNGVEKVCRSCFGTGWRGRHRA
jgi:DnaJ-class molecular chaperone